MFEHAGTNGCLHFSSILHRVAIPVVSYTNLVYVGYYWNAQFMWDAIVLHILIVLPRSCMSKHGATILTTKQSK